MLSALQKLESVGTGSILQAEIHSFICRPTDSSRVCLSRHIFSRQTTEQGAKLLTNPDLFLFHHQNVGDMRYFSPELLSQFPHPRPSFCRTDKQAAIFTNSVLQTTRHRSASLDQELTERQHLQRKYFVSWKKCDRQCYPKTDGV